jgi:hypothetical protein
MSISETIFRKNMTFEKHFLRTIYESKIGITRTEETRREEKIPKCS